MSEMVLKLPSSYVDVERDEMEYVDGGGSMTYNRLATTLIQFGMASSIVFLVNGLRTTIAGLMAGVSLIRGALSALGVGGFILGAYVGWKLTFMVNSIGQALDQHKGINYGMGWTGPYIYCQ